MRASLKRALFGIVSAAAVAVPSMAHAGTTHWAVSGYLSAGQSLYNPGYSSLLGVYCHELDGAQTRFIQINAVVAINGPLYGSWVQYTTDGYRAYSGNNYLHGACRNPHSVGYYYNAHDNYVDV
ncbi:MAG: hypothetical protein JWQ20_1650 [Conexibacter sp.]|jgi:hypothetical protein|nr:hypothetical protein [Solirubrobacterales bacterium]MCW3002352.1 hypothetical protein [Conexibacter sp.]